MHSVFWFFAVRTFCSLRTCSKNCLTVQSYCSHFKVNVRESFTPLDASFSLSSPETSLGSKVLNIIQTVKPLREHLWFWLIKTNKFLYESSHLNMCCFGKFAPQLLCFFVSPALFWLTKWCSKGLHHATFTLTVSQLFCRLISHMNTKESIELQQVVQQHWQLLLKTESPWTRVQSWSHIVLSVCVCVTRC